MPQFVQTQPRSVDPALLALQQAGAQRRDTSEEQARLNAGQYMKDFRQDAANAGYSLGEWAKRNESNVKNALFSLSGNNQQVMEAKFNELANAPESFKQKEQRLLDVASAQAPETLFGTAPTTETTTTTTGAVSGIEGTTFTSDQALARAVEKGIGNMLVLGADMLGMSLEELKADEEASAKVLEWRKQIAEDVDYKGDPANWEKDADGKPIQVFTGKGTENETLFQYFKGGPSKTFQREDEVPKFEIDPNLRQQFSTIDSILQTRGAVAGGSNVKEILADPLLKAEARKEAETPWNSRRVCRSGTARQRRRTVWRLQWP